MTHKHYCVGKCGAYVTCNARVISDDCGAHCEREEDPDDGKYECEDCYQERTARDDEEAWDGETTPASGLSQDD